MFVSSNVPALFKKGTLKLTTNDEGETRRVAETMCVIEPFPAVLAHELGEDVAGHLLNADGSIRDELESIDLRIRCGLQNVTVRHHEELEPLAKLTPVSVKDVSVKRVEDEKLGRAWLALSFVLVFSLEEKTARNFVLDEFGKPLLWTFESMHGDLVRQAELHESLARLGDPTGDGKTTVSFGSAGNLQQIDPDQHRQRAAELRKQANRKTH